MPTLTDRLNDAIAQLQAEKTRIKQQALADAAQVDTKIAALQSATASITPDVETSYAQLRSLGLIKEI